MSELIRNSESTGGRSRLSIEDGKAIREYWLFCEPRRVAITAGLHRVMAALPAWTRVYSESTPEARAAEDARIHALQRDAIVEDEWEPFLADLHARGSRYAHAGVTYSAWFDLLIAYRDLVREHMSRFLQEDVDANLRTASTISHGMNRLFDVMMETIGEAYITSREQLVLARREERYQTLFENSPLPTWTYDPTTLQFVTVNEAAIRHYGFSRDEFEAMTLAAIRPAEDVDALLNEARQATGLVEPRTWRHRKKDGTIITVEIQASDLVDHGRAVRLVIVTDVTERDRALQALRKTEERLGQVQKLEAIGRLAGEVAHDFNNILYVVGTYATLLEESLAPTDVRHEDAAEIRRAAGQAAGITRQLLTLSRHGLATPCSIHLDEVVASFAPMLRRLVGDRIKLVIHRGDVPLVLADAGQVEQVLMNLAVNARDAMPAGGSLTVETAVVTIDDDSAVAQGFGPGRFVVLAMTDTGIGMDAETRQRMFDAFFTTKDATHGTGLGLAIVHGIVAQAGGHISVYSELGHGTTFRMFLPVTEETVATQRLALVVGPRTLPPMTVLVVDANRDVRAAVIRVLHEAGCRTLQAATAEEARRICVSHDDAIDVVLVDVVLPDLRGDLLATQLRELRPMVKSVLMSGYPLGALTAGGGTPVDLLTKPFSSSELRAAIARVVVVDGESAAHPTASNLTRRVLVVDDDEVLLRTLARVLRKHDFEVVETDNGQSAMAEVAKASFDVIVTDVQMPRMNGLDLLRAVRRIDLDVPVVMMSGEPSVEAAATAVEHGAFRYLTKPFEIDELAKLVGQAARANAFARLRREAFAVGGTQAGAVDRAGLEVRYEQAVDGLYMAFQPIVDARNGVPFGVEALMRSTELSLPNPQAILDAATTLGRLPHLGRRIRALSAAAISSRDDDLALFVNLHPDDLLDVDLINESAPLTEIASRVILEVTERASLSNSPELTARVARLRNLGFRIAVDDIGSGYSGLTSFTELNPEIVKLDMAIVRDVHLSTLKQRTIRALCRLCHEGGCLVVAEGVETLDERECLTELGCDLLQGYLIARPKRELMV